MDIPPIVISNLKLISRLSRSELKPDEPSLLERLTGRRINAEPPTTERLEQLLREAYEEKPIEQTTPKEPRLHAYPSITVEVDTAACEIYSCFLDDNGKLDLKKVVEVKDALDEINPKVGDLFWKTIRFYSLEEFEGEVSSGKESKMADEFFESALALDPSKFVKRSI